MLTIIDEIISYLQNDYIFTVDIPSENIVEAYSVNTPDYSNPYITVEEITNLPQAETYTDKEEYSIIGYQIEVYTTQQEVNGIMLSARETCRRILSEITEAINDKFGLVRNTSPTILPATEDSSVQRGILRCEATIDKTHKYLYRR